MFPLSFRTLRRSAAHPSVALVAVVLAGCLASPPLGIRLLHSIAYWVAVAFVAGTLVWLVAGRYIAITDRETARVIRTLKAAAAAQRVAADAAAMPEPVMPMMQCPPDCRGCAGEQLEAQRNYERLLLDTAVRHGHIPAERTA